MPENTPEELASTYWRGTANAHAKELDLQATEFRQRESMWMKRIKDLEAERASWHECYMGAVRTMEAGAKETDRLREAARSILWMAKEYAEAGGRGGPEMRDYEAAAEIIDAD
jgi:uncharacterized coiled-coil DUF342 family protein